MPPTLPHSVREAEYMLRLVSTGFWASRALSTALEINLFGALAGCEFGLEELASKMRVNPRGLETVVRFCAAITLIEQTGDGKFKLTEAGRLLDPDLAGNFSAAEVISSDVWDSFATLSDKVVHGSPGDAREYFRSLTADQRRGFFDTMARQAQCSVGSFVEKVDLSGIRTVVDVGCGPGVFSIELLKRYRNLKVVLLDNPDALSLTRDRMRHLNISDRVIFQEGDFWEQDVSIPYDAVMFSRILHDWDDACCRQLLSRFIDPMPVGGLTIICEEVIHDRRQPELWPALVDLFLFCRLGSGRTRTLEEIGSLLKSAECEVSAAEKAGDFLTVITAWKSDLTRL